MELKLNGIKKQLACSFAICRKCEWISGVSKTGETKSTAD